MQRSHRRPRDVEQLLLGRTVIARYNNRTYRIDEIDWQHNPVTFTFPVRIDSDFELEHNHPHLLLTISFHSNTFQSNLLEV